tara:strand:+ start:1175 stop:1369 length:195 start_codon:yes stop_codon:yes gene_type:complete
MVKKRSLNELRQTKDSVYKVPVKVDSKNLEFVVNEFNSENKENNFELNDVKKFFRFLKSKGYRF